MRKVLIACEYSGVVRTAFASKGCDSWSNDILETEVEGNHIQGDCFEAISRGWDMIIMHPPCTALCVSGNRHYGKGCPKNSERLTAIEWTMRLWVHAKANANHVAMENPVGVLPIKASQYVQPWQFGHPETKKTGLWLYNLPPLMSTMICKGREQRIHRLPRSKDRWKIRSRTYTGIAKAMADQWSDIE